GALVAMGELYEVGDVGRVEVGGKRPRRLVVAVGDGVEHFAHELGPQPVFLVMDPVAERTGLQFMRGKGDVLALAHDSLPRSTRLMLRAASLCPKRHWRNPARGPRWPQSIFTSQ